MNRLIWFSPFAYRLNNGRFFFYLYDMEEETIKNNEDTIQFRLSSIEKSLEDLKSYIIETKLQQKDIDLIYKKLEHLETEVGSFNGRLDKIEKKPAKKFDEIISYIWYFVVGGIIGYLFLKLGIQN